MRDNSSHIVIIFLLTLITLNLFLLDLKVFSPSGSIQISDISVVATPNPSPAGSTYAIQPQNLICPNSCISLIQQSTSSASRIGSTNQLPTTNNPFDSSQGKQPLTSREFYVPLGSGSTAKSDWDDQTSTETVIDPANYGHIREAYFIASLRNPTQNGQVEAQLYNVTDKHLVWGSHVIMNGPSSQTITSDKITLDSGSKLYRVQLKSTLSFAATLDNAKLRIITD